MTTTAGRTDTADTTSPEADYGNPRLSVRNPGRRLRVAIWIAGLSAVAAAAGGITLAAGAKAVGSSLLGIGAGGLVAAAFLLPAYFYSRRNPERARRTADHQRAAQEQRLRRHPVAYLIGLPIAVGVLAPLRVGLRHHSDTHESYSLLTLVVIGLAAAAVTAVIVGFLVRRAQRRGGRQSSQA